MKTQKRMKGLVLLIVFVIVSMALSAQNRQIFAPKLSPFQKTEIKIGIVDVTLEYSRPSMRGRKIFGELLPYDKVWRTGANINTRITFSNNIIIGGIEIEAGTYTIFTKPNIGEWEIFVHTELNKYGAPDTLEHGNIIANFVVPATKLDRSIETLSISFENLTNNSAILAIAWENTYVPISIKIPTDSILEEVLSTERDNLIEDYRAAAKIYFEVEKDSKKALEAINYSISLLLNGKSMEEWLEIADLSDRHLPNKFKLKSEILADLGRKDEAIEFARKSLRIANLVGDEFYQKRNTENLKKWSN